MSSSTDPFVAWQGEIGHDNRKVRVVIDPRVSRINELRVRVEAAHLDAMGTVSWTFLAGEQRDYALRCAIDQLAR